MKVAELDPDETVTEDGTESDELLSERATDCPPLPAAALKLTVHVELPGGVQDEGLHVRFVTVGSTGWGCEMVTVPELPDDGIDPPAAVTAEVVVICNCPDVAEVPGAIVALTAATTPLEMVVVLNPVARQTMLPDPPEHVTDFPAAEAAEPVVIFKAENTDVGYVIVH